METLSASTTLRWYPLTLQTMAMPMPVLPDEGSIKVWPGSRMPSFSASSIIDSAIRSFTEPPGFCPSSLMKRRTPGFGLSGLMSTSGVLPIRSRTEPNEVIGRKPSPSGSLLRPPPAGSRSRPSP